MVEEIFGSTLKYLWVGFCARDEIASKVVHSTLEISPEHQIIIKNEWKKVLERNPSTFDGFLWRYEGFYIHNGKTNIELSPTSYSPHRVLRDIKKQPTRFYPNPIGVNTVQITPDGYIVLGIRKDNGLICVAGAGYVDKKADNQTSSAEPENFFDTMKRECIEELDYGNEMPFKTDEARTMGIIFGRFHTATMSMYLPLNVKSKDITIKEPEHSELVFLHDD